MITEEQGKYFIQQSVRSSEYNQSKAKISYEAVFGTKHPIELM